MAEYTYKEPGLNERYESLRELLKEQVRKRKMLPRKSVRLTGHSTRVD